MNDDTDARRFKVGELVRKIGQEHVGEVVSVEKDGLFVRYKNECPSVIFYSTDLVERVKTVLEP